MNEEMARITAQNQALATAIAIVDAERARHRAETSRGRTWIKATRFVKRHPWAFTSAAVLGGLVAVTR